MAFKIADAFVSVSYDIDGAEEKLRQAFANKRETVNVDADTKQADSKVAAFSKALRGASDTKLKVDADTTPADRQVAALQRKLATLDAQKVKVEAETAAATAKIDELKSTTTRKIDEINARELKIDADIAQAEQIGRASCRERVSSPV